MKKFQTENGLTLGGDLVDEETGEIISIGDNDFIVNGKHIQAGFGTWLREDSAGSRQVGFDATTSTKLDFYIGGAVEASLTASGLTGLENLSLADNKNLYLGTGNDFRMYFTGTDTIFNAVAGDLKIQDNGTDRYTFGTTAGNLTITGSFSGGTITGSSFDGPAEHSTRTSGTLAAGDMNTTISATGGITINNSIGSQGDIVIVYNNSAANITITQGTGVTLRLAGSATTGNRTIAQRGIACIYYHSASDVAVGGTGVT